MTILVRFISVLWVVALSGCATFDSVTDKLANPAAIHQEDASDSPADKAAKIPINDYYQALTQVHDYSKGVKNPNEYQTKIYHYVGEGIGLVDTYCRRWFRAIEESQRRLAKSTADYNVISQLGTALIGVAKLHSDVTTVYGAANTALSGFGRNFDEAYLIAPSADNVKIRVFQALEGRAIKLRSPTDKPKTFKAAYTALESYADICTYTKAKSIANTLMVTKPGETLQVEETGRIEIVGAATRVQAKRKNEVAALVDKVAALDDKTATALAANLPVVVPTSTINVARDVVKGDQLKTNGDAARAFLRQILVQTAGDDATIDAWSNALNRVVDQRTKGD